MILAWLLLLTGLTISAVAIYYSVVGLAAIFSAAVIPIIVMGSALEVAKLVCASWLKANWSRAPRLMRIYMTTAVVVLMLITSMGIFGFLSKAHSDQSLVSGDVTSKISIYDEKIKIAKDNIEANRKALKQMDEAVDQVMARSDDEKGADKAVAIRRGQQKERARLQAEITAEQKVITQLNEERAPIAAEVRKVEAEVGPLKYIAAFVYGATDESVLERAVTWVIITIIVVFDPLAVIMLLAAQMTFGWHNKGHDLLSEETPDPYVPDVGEKPTAEELVEELAEEPVEEDDIEAVEEAANDATIETTVQPTLEWPFPSAKAPDPILDVYNDERLVTKFDKQALAETPVVVETEPQLDKWEEAIATAEEIAAADLDAKKVEEAEKYIPDIERPGDYLNDQERVKPDLTEVIEPEGSKKKTYMMKDPTGHFTIKTTE